VRELTERSQALQDAILNSPALLAELVERIAKGLKGKIELPEGSTYLFTPKVYRRPAFLPEIYIQASAELTIPPIPFPGPLDPWLVKILERQRLVSVDDAHAGKPTAGAFKDLNTQILASPALLGELSTAIAEVLERHGIKLAADETYAFEAVALEKPIFGGLAAEYQPARMPATARALAQVPAAALAPTAELPLFKRWWQGIPAPEFLIALEKTRLQSVSAGR
jgi:hypothetical protein